jgi:chemotaxis protein histidine kinase CheA
LQSDWGKIIVDAATHQKILGYFIEEAKEHIETLESGVLELSIVVKDSERLNELFRAAHSVKGGAAMLGYTSIQKTAHRLEDAFKILKENDIPIDSSLEQLFFHGYEVLKNLIEKLQSPFGLKEEEGDQVLKESEPDFIHLQEYLDQLLHGGSPTPIATTPVKEEKSTSDLPGEIRKLLKEMLKLFQQKSTPETRQKLQKLCVSLAKLKDSDQKWQGLMKLAHKAISNPKHSYRVLAPVIIKEIKQASDLIELGKADQIEPNDSLKQLVKAQPPQVLIAVEPQSAAKTLKAVFNKQQLSQLIKLLSASGSR